jgi:hypothetical protein
MKKIIMLLATVLFLWTVSFGQNPSSQKVSTEKITLQEIAKVIPDNLKKEYTVLPTATLDSINAATKKTIEAKEELITALENKPISGKPIDWAVYVFSILSIFIILVATKFRIVYDFMINSKWVLLQRLAASSTKFIYTIQGVCISLSAILYFILSLNLITDINWISIINYTINSCVAIASILLFTSKEKQHNK